MDGVKRLPCRENGPRSCSFLATIIKELSCISPGRENETARANRERDRQRQRDREERLSYTSEDQKYEIMKLID
jgi:hypothetical protein